MFRWVAAPLAAGALFIGGASADAGDAGVIKIVQGTAWVERAGARLRAAVGFRVRSADVIVTGRDGAVGITFADDSRLSIGPNSTLAIERFAFNTTTHDGTFETALRAGTMAAVSGKLTRQSPEAMKVRTPVSILGVRGTTFVVRVTATGPAPAQ